MNFTIIFMHLNFCTRWQINTCWIENWIEIIFKLSDQLRFVWLCAAKWSGMTIKTAAKKVITQNLRQWFASLFGNLNHLYNTSNLFSKNVRFDY